jgi:hypothetical protein
MLDIYLTDVQKNVQFNDYPGEHPVKFVLNFKRFSQVLWSYYFLYYLKMKILKK